LIVFEMMMIFVCQLYSMKLPAQHYLSMTAETATEKDAHVRWAIHQHYLSMTAETGTEQDTHLQWATDNTVTEQDTHLQWATHQHQHYELPMDDDTGSEKDTLGQWATHHEH
jgi:hypothetical protein